jgi:hypothetical protein
MQLNRHEHRALAMGVTVDTAGGTGSVITYIHAADTAALGPLIFIFALGFNTPEVFYQIPVYTGAGFYPHTGKFLPLGAALYLHIRFPGNFDQFSQQFPDPGRESLYAIPQGQPPQGLRVLQGGDPPSGSPVIVIQADDDPAYPTLQHPG